MITRLLDTRVWDAVVIGAGPAGATAGTLLARRGQQALLLERSSWPREKVCGGCVGGRAMTLLRELDLADATHGGRALDRARITIRSSAAQVATQPGIAIPREQLDAKLVERFIAAGGTFVHDASATLLPATAADTRSLNVTVAGVPHVVSARCVIAADGIGGRCLRDEAWAEWRVDRRSRIGVSAILKNTNLPSAYAGGCVHMHVGDDDDGYVGVARMADGSLHLAAALSPDACRTAGGPAAMIESIGRSCGRAWTIDRASVRGTTTLSRRRATIAGHRVMAVGDACGYVEPFTGEGIGWAIASADAAVRLLGDDGTGWSADMPQRWRAAHDRAVAREKRVCRAVRAVLRWPAATRIAVAALRVMPELSTLILHRAHTPCSSARSVR